MTKPLNLIGLKFNRLTVIKREPNNRWGQTRWLCRCDCGKLTVVGGTDLKKGHIKSCGCLNLETSLKNLPDNSTHHTSRTHLYSVWSLMKQRCENPKHKSYAYYGGRGIKICAEWHDAATFFEWARSSGYREDLSLERINVNGDYEPSNCTWVTMREQARNKRNNVWIEYQGQKMLLSDVAKLLGLTYPALKWRYDHGDRGDRLFRPARVKRTVKYGSN